MSPSPNLPNPPHPTPPISSTPHLTFCQAPSTRTTTAPSTLPIPAAAPASRQPCANSCHLEISLTAEGAKALQFFSLSPSPSPRHTVSHAHKAPNLGERLRCCFTVYSNTICSLETDLIGGNLMLQGVEGEGGAHTLSLSLPGDSSLSAWL